MNSVPFFGFGLEVGLGPLTEAEASDAQSPEQESFLAFRTTGRAEDFRVTFEVHKSSIGNPPSGAKISLYNLSSQTVSRIRKQFTSCQMNFLVGNSATNDLEDVGVLTSGSVISCFSERDGADIITNLSTYDGFNGTSLGLFSLNIKGEVELNDLLSQALSTLDGVKIGEINVSAKTGSKGVVVSGRTVDIINKWSQHYGFTWWIADGIFNAYDDGAYSGTTYNVSAQNGNLINATPILTDPIGVQVGVRLSIIIDPRILPNDRVNLVSTINPDLNGEYLVTNITHRGDTHSTEGFVSDIECLTQTFANTGDQ